MAPKRKADALTEDKKSNTTTQRATRSAGPANSVVMPSKSTIRSKSAASPTKPAGKKVYGGKRTIKTTIELDTDEESNANKQETEPEAINTKPRAKARNTRGQTLKTVEVEMASTSSKENTRTVPNTPRGRPKRKQPEEEHLELDELPVVKPRQPSKRRKVTPPSADEVPPIQIKRTRNHLALASEASRGRRKLPQAKTSTPPASEVEDEDSPPTPLKGRGSTRLIRATPTGRRPLSPTPNPSDGSPKKRHPSAKKPVSPAPQEDGDAHREEESTPGPSRRPKRATLVVEIELRTPRRRRGAAAVLDEDQEEETVNLPSSPIKPPVFPTTPSTRHRIGTRSVPNSPTKGSTLSIPEHLTPCLNAQKRAVLRALHNPPVAILASKDEPIGKGKGKAKAKAANVEEEDYDNDIAYEQLKALLEGTTARDEGNSCLLLGPRGSGKTRLVERCLGELAKTSEIESKAKPIIIRLSGWVQSNDRLALRQIAVQLAEQTGDSYLSHFEDGENVQTGVAQNDDENPFHDASGADANEGATSLPLPPSSHLPALIALLPTLNRPTIVLVDAFDLFALHPRQALLYCLLDTAQACQSSQGNKGLAVIGLSSRVDVVQLLEKRVKSRFSGRILRVSNVQKEEGWLKIMRRCLYARDPSLLSDESADEWNEVWSEGVEAFLDDPTTQRLVHETYSIVRDVRVLLRLLVPVIAHLSPFQPFPTSTLLQRASQTQRTRAPFPSLHTLSYPALCLLIASYHSDTKGHPTFNFEMMYEAFRAQLRASMAAPIQLNGTSIGMVKCSRAVMSSAFESLVSARIFVAAAAPSSTMPKEFVKYRSVIERDDMKKAIEKAGQVNLRKWLSKS